MKFIYYKYKNEYFLNNILYKKKYSTEECQFVPNISL